MGIVTALLLCAPQNTQAKDAYDLDTGNEFYTTCSHANISSTVMTLCVGFIDGLANGVIGAAHLTKDDIYCSPQNATYGQVLDIFSKYLGEHPENRHGPSGDLFVLAMREAFPCK